MKTDAQHWRYTAEDPTGAVLTGVIAATDLAGARSELRARRLTPLALKSERQDLHLAFLGRRHRKEALPLREIAAIARRLSDLLGAALPLAHALRLAAEQAQRPRERAFLRQIVGDVRAGRPMSEALIRNDFETPRLFHALVEAGEALGSLDRQMHRLADHYDETLKLRREILSQLVYPVALVVLIIATIFFLSFLVLPQFESIFETSGAAPPPETRFVLAVGAVIRALWPIMPLILLGIVLATKLLARRYATQFERAWLSAPIGGKLLRFAEFGVFLRTLATLLDGGAGITKSMPLARQTLSQSILAAEIGAAETAVRSGERLAPALRRLTSCPAELISFIEIGEETGELGRLVGQAAAHAEALVGQTVRRFMALLAPVLTALMGLLTAGVIASVMTGVLSLNETIY